MKTAEQKAKAYDEALKKIKECTPDENGSVTIYPSEIFPELKESEDERIRKKLIKLVKMSSEVGGFALHKWEADEMLAWLEKQGGITKLSEEEQNRFAKGVLTSCASSFIDYLDAHKYEGKMCVSNGECEDIENAFHNAMWDRLHRYYCKYIEKQCEQRSDIGISSTTKQKLKDNLNKALQKETCDSWNEFLDEQNPMTGSKFKVGDKVVHKGTGKTWTVHWYIKEDNTYSVEDSEGLINIYSPDVLEPIEQKQKWSEEDETICYSLLADIKTRRDSSTNTLEAYYNDQIEWLKSLKDRVQPKQEWGEEDERERKHCVDFLNHPDMIEAAPNIANSCKDWLKNLRPQNRWKPSDEQMEAIQTAIGIVGELTPTSMLLKELREQLKKLKG